MLSKEVSRAWWAVVALFFVHGLIVSNWVSRIPAIQNALHLANGVLGLALLTSALGAVITIPVAGWLITRYGSKKITAHSTVAFCLTLIFPGFATNAWTLAVALFLFGSAAACMDVSMNAQGVEVEKRLGRPTMSRFHAMFSIGGMAGAMAGGVVASRGVAPLPHFAVGAVLYIACALLVSPMMIETHDEGITPSSASVPLHKMPRVLFALSAIAFCILLAEGAMADWTAVYLRQINHASAGVAALGYAVFSGAMALFRLLGDLITAKLGPLLTVRLGSMVGAAGLVWVICMQSAEWTLPGFGAVGAGFSVIIPLVFGAGGRVPSVSPGAGIATVTGIGYIGFIVGPPTIGFASQVVTLRYALLVVIACCLVAALLSGFLGRLPTKTSDNLNQPSVAV